MLFSVVIPAYKSLFLKKCIASILAQTYKEFELVVVNDASPENLDDIINGFADSRIRYYKNEKNCGAIDVVDNWNKCLGYAKGEYLICMGDDDMLAPNALEEYVGLISRYPNVDLFHSRVKQIDENDDFIKLTDARPEWESVLSMMWHRMAHRQQYIGDYLFRTETLKSVGGFFKLPYAWASDDITSYLVAAEHGCVHTNCPTFYYRINRQTITQSGNAEIKMKALIETDLWYKDFATEYQPESNEDFLLKTMILKGLRKYSLQQKSKLISGDMSKSFWNIFKFFLRRKKYEISIPLLAYATFEYLKIRNRS